MGGTELTTADYTVGWISALAFEVAAALEFLDEEYGKPNDLDLSDPNSYIFGRLHEHITLSQPYPMANTDLHLPPQSPLAYKLNSKHSDSD